ncbi:hypothetical protein COTS27_01683 [Spirochaetota bacterium]|nr:hypothetical protein COTS27_01683 [Spirochaetota bacterium]
MKQVSSTEVGISDKSQAVIERGILGYVKRFFKTAYTVILLWVDSERTEHLGNSTKFNFPRVIPFIAVHLMCLGVIWVGWSPFAVIFAIVFYLVRMFAITGIYHRYFAHRTYKLNRFWQFMFALFAATCAQRGALWWAAHHRHHHRYSDTEKDIHSPVHGGFWWSHMGWFTSDVSFRTPYQYIKDFAKYPELRFLNRFDILVPTLTGVAVFYIGKFMSWQFPALGVTGPQLLIWGFFISTIILFHATVSINSLTHIWGRKRFETKDESRNNWFLSIFTLGEGWHNNHHYYPATARQGFYWWEFDITYYVLKALSWVGIVRDLRPVPEAVYVEAKIIKDKKKQQRLKKKHPKSVIPVVPALTPASRKN